MSFTARELSAIQEQLDVEQALFKKFALYAEITRDARLRAQFETNCAKHKQQYDQLLGQLR